MRSSVRQSMYLSIHRSVHPSVFLPTHASIHPSTYRFLGFLSISIERCVRYTVHRHRFHPLGWLAENLSVFSSVCPSVNPSLRLPTYLSVCSSNHPSVHLSIHPFVSSVFFPLSGCLWGPRNYRLGVGGFGRRPNRLKSVCRRSSHIRTYQNYRQFLVSQVSGGRAFVNVLLHDFRYSPAARARRHSRLVAGKATNPESLPNPLPLGINQLISSSCKIIEKYMDIDRVSIVGWFLRFFFLFCG